MNSIQNLLNNNNVDNERFDRLRDDALTYTEKSAQIQSGFGCKEEIKKQKHKIMELLGASEEDWQDWKWQMKHRIRDGKTLAAILDLSGSEVGDIEKTGKIYRWALSPYYLSLIIGEAHDSPVYKQSVPDMRELFGGGKIDPVGEKETSPAPRITRRYPDRLIINITNQCAMYCRHCQRRRNIGEVDTHATTQDIIAALDYVRAHEEIRDVLVTGGDALMLSDNKLEWVLTELDNISHVEIKRLGTRTPVTLPQRITPELCEILKRHAPIYINSQFNHPMEVTEEAKLACDRLVEAGVLLGNQAVLLAGINDDRYVMRKLNHELLKIRVRPYYIFHAKDVKGTQHFHTTIQCGIDIIENLRGHTSGLAIPTFVVNAPHGYGKIPVMPEYVVEKTDDHITLRTWEGRQYRFEE